MWVQTITTAETMSQGSQPCQRRHLRYRVAFGARRRRRPERPGDDANSGSRAGFQTRRNTSVTINAVSDDSTSVSA